MMYVTSIGFFVKEKKGKRRKKGREKKRKKMQEIWFVGFILAEGKREKKKKNCAENFCMCVFCMAVIVVIIISCGLGNGKFCNIGYCVAVIGQNT